MFKKAAQRGRSERGGEAYSFPYVETPSDARTKLAVFFNILLLVAAERLAAGIAAMDFVPPADFRFAQLPTEIHDTSFMQMRKVAEAHLDVLDHHAQFLDFLKMVVDLFQGGDIMGSHEASPSELCVFTGLFYLVLG